MKSSSSDECDLDIKDDDDLNDDDNDDLNDDDDDVVMVVVVVAVNMVSPFDLLFGDVVMFLRAKQIEPYPEEAGSDVDLSNVASA